MELILNVAEENVDHLLEMLKLHATPFDDEPKKKDVKMLLIRDEDDLIVGRLVDTK